MSKDGNGKEMPDNLRSLHFGEELLREKAMAFLTEAPHQRLHLDVIVQVMNLLDLYRQFETDDEDLKALQALGIRCFNALGASMKLILSGYSQAAALLLRDVLETSFLFDLMGSDHGQIAKWRLATRRDRMREFSALKVREQLDKRDGFAGLKRAEHYQLLSELAGHASMTSLAMLRPQGMDIQIGPFIDPTVLEAVLSEMGKIVVHLGDIATRIVPKHWSSVMIVCADYDKARRAWIDHFYSVDPNSV